MATAVVTTAAPTRTPLTCPIGNDKRASTSTSYVMRLKSCACAQFCVPELSDILEREEHGN